MYVFGAVTRTNNFAYCWLQSRVTGDRTKLVPTFHDVIVEESAIRTD
jgi:hypothetical protein